MTTSTAMLEAALAYARRGWAVFPCHTPTAAGCSCGKADCGSVGKHPRVVNGVKDATTDADTIRRWWGRWPEANVGIATGGASGVVVLDLDGPEAVDALDEFAGTSARPDAPEAATGRGRHLFFRCPEGGFGNRAKVRGKPIDVRGDGGYVIAAPSLHQSGRRYSWVMPPNGHVPEIPNWLADFLRPPPAVPSPIPARSSPSTPDQAKAIERARAYVAKMPPSIQGSNGSAAAMAVARALVWGFALDSETAYGIFASEFNPTCVPPWSEREILHKLADASKPSDRKPYGWLRDAERPNGNDHHVNGHVDVRGIVGQAGTNGYEPPPPQDEPAPAAPDGCGDGGGFVYDPIDSATFATGDYRPTWLVKRLLVARQPCVVGAPRKSLKTSTMVDLAVSLATCSPFLGEFDVYKPVKVAFLSGESGESATQSIALRVCQSKGLDLATVPVLWSFTLPRLANKIDVGNLVAGLNARGAEVVIVDPLYLCLASDGTVDTKNLFDVGPLLLRIAKACLDAGVTPILIHHARKNLPHEASAPMDLEDLAFAGIQEFARQWLLLNRRETYDPTTPGEHRLWLSAGGSIGHGGLWALNVSEGELEDDFGGRRWQVEIERGADAIERKTTSKGRAKQDRAQQERMNDENACLDEIRNLRDQDIPATCRQLILANREHGLSKERTEAALIRLQKQSLIVKGTHKGKGRFGDTDVYALAAWETQRET